MEPLPEAPEGNEGLSRETPRCHLTVWLLVLPRWAFAHKTASEPVYTPATIFAHAWHTSTRRDIYFTVVSCRRNQEKKRSGKLCCLWCSIWILQYYLESLLMPFVILSVEVNEDGYAIWMNDDLSLRIPPIDYLSINPMRHAITLPSENRSNSFDWNPLVATRRFRVQVGRISSATVEIPWSSTATSVWN